MDTQKPQNGSSVNIEYKYSGTVVDFKPAGFTSSVMGANAGTSSFSLNVPKLVYKFYGLDSDVMDITTVAEVAPAIPGLASMNVVTDEDLARIKAEEEAKPHGLEWGLVALSSVGNVVMGLGEGLLSFGESLLDAAAVVSTAVHTPLILWGDFVEGVVTGEWDLSQVEDAWNRTAKAVSFDMTGAAFDALYDNCSFFIGMNEYASYWNAERGGVVYEIADSVGYYTGVVLASTLLGPAFAGASSTAMTASVMTVSSLGKEAQTEYGALYEASGGKDVSISQLSKATAYSTVKAGISGSVYAGAGVLKSAGQGFGYVLGSIGLKATKPWLNELADFALKDGKYEWDAALIDTGGIIIAEFAAVGFSALRNAIKGDGAPRGAFDSKLSQTSDRQWEAYQARNSAFSQVDDEAFKAYQVRNGVAAVSMGNVSSNAFASVEAAKQTLGSRARDAVAHATESVSKTLKPAIDATGKAVVKAADKDVEKTVKEVVTSTYEAVVESATGKE